MHPLPISTNTDILITHTHGCHFAATTWAQREGPKTKITKGGVAPGSLQLVNNIAKEHLRNKKSRVCLIGEPDTDSIKIYLCNCKDRL